MFLTPNKFHPAGRVWICPILVKLSHVHLCFYLPGLANRLPHVYAIQCICSSFTSQTTTLWMATVLVVLRKVGNNDNGLCRHMKMNTYTFRYNWRWVSSQKSKFEILVLVRKDFLRACYDAAFLAIWFLFVSHKSPTV